MHEELSRPQVMAAVEDLVAREASGILEVTGTPSGAIYLDGGRIVFARAPWVPGLAARLRGVSPSLAGLRELSPGPEGDEAAVAGFAVQQGYLTVAALHGLIESIVVDAFLLLTVPLARESPVAEIRFTSTRTYWTELFPRFSIEAVRGKALSMAERIARCGLAPTTVVKPCDLREPAAVLTREQWAVACQIGDRASARDIAALRGTALSATLEALGSLARAGLCVPVHVGRPRPQPAPVSGPSGSLGPSGSFAAPGSFGPPAGPPGPPGPPSQPGRRDEPPVGRLPVRQAVHARAGDPGEPPTPDILRQVLNGLRRL
jgi:hypothetical protein